LRWPALVLEQPSDTANLSSKQHCRPIAVVGLLVPPWAARSESNPLETSARNHLPRVACKWPLSADSDQ
jgi:hypothetical protein